MTQTIYPALRYADGDAALAWLKEAFGVSEKEVHRDEHGAIVHAELHLEGGLIMFGQYGPEGFSGGTAPQPLASTLSLYVIVADPDAHHDQALSAGATIVRELQDTPYGSREYSARDLEGNLWSFGTYDPNAPMSD